MREIIILAMGPSRGLCPFDAEVWGVNQGYLQIGQMRGRLDKLFLAHSQAYSFAGNPLIDWGAINHLADAGVEIINTHKVKGVKSKLFPLKSVVKKFGIDYFSDTICYMLAYALYINTKRDRETGKVVLRQPLKLRLYGVDVQDKDEYLYEKPGIEFWIGYGMGLGVEFTVSLGSTLLTCYTGSRYGIRIPKSSYDPLGLLKRKRLLTQDQAGKLVERFEFNKKKLKSVTDDQILELTRGNASEIGNPK